MSRFIKFMLLALLSLPFVACDNNVVSRAEYDALVAENDSLQFELSSLQAYVECLEEDNAELVDELKRTKCY